jgi:sensor domain CHASE-containing protein
MDGQSAQVAAAVGVPCLLGLVWLLRLEGRVNTQERLQDDLKDDVRYIRERIDKALNGHV